MQLAMQLEPRLQSDTLHSFHSGEVFAADYQGELVALKRIPPAKVDVDTVYMMVMQDLLSSLVNLAKRRED